MKTRKEHLLEGLSSIEHDLESRKGKGALRPSEHIEHEVPKDEHQEHDEEHETKEVEHHLVASGQFDCPHCGKGVKVGAKHE
jgi:hypothetical protein